MTLVSILKFMSSRDDDEVDQTLQNFFCKMFLIGKAICFILAILFTIVAVITNSQNNSRRVPPPKPFFSRELWVEDFYGGELYYALLKATKYDVIFLMLYAPWDADSQNARSEFETTCRYFGRKVYCAAVNCWQSHTGCRAFFDNIAMYPVFLVDLHNIPSIRYHGEIIASHMIRFLNSVIAPIERICSVEKFYGLQNTCDALIVTYLPDYQLYKRYYKASLKILEYDPRREVCWSIVTDGEVANSLHLYEFSLRLYLWNDSKEFEDSFTSKNIVKWVREHVQMLTQWLFFTNARNNRLADLVQNNKAVILFTPRNMYLKYIPTYLLFKEAVMDFKSCFVDLDIDNRRASVANQRKQIAKEYDYWEHLCSSRFTYKTSNFNASIFDTIDENYEKYVFTSSASLLNITNSDSPSEMSTLNWKYLPGLLKSKINSSVDDTSAENLVLHNVREKCRQLNMLKKTYEYSFLSSKLVHPSDITIPETLCSLNDSYTFFAIDSLLYPHVAWSLGIDLSRYKDLTTVVIFNNKNEEVFVLPQEFDNKRVLHELLIKSVNHTIPRWTKSTKNPSIYLNRYNKSNNPIPQEISVLELTSESFQSVVFNSSQHVVVYYYTAYCSYCQVSAYTFLHVAHALKNYSRIKFTRVDSENNDLDWHLVPHSYPTIVLFPADRKSENVVFTPERALTVDNLLNFVLSNVEAEIKMNYMLDKCNEHKNKESASSHSFIQCVHKAKTYCLRVINTLAKTYTKILLNVPAATNSSASLESLLSRMKHLKSVYFHLDNMFRLY